MALKASERKVQIPWEEGALEGWFVEGETSKPLVLLMHGANNDMDHPLLVQMVHVLAPEGWSLLRFNFDFVKTHRIDFPKLYREILAAEAWARQQHPEGPLFLVGKSLGAYMATHRAVLKPGVAGIVALGYPFQQADGTPIDQSHLSRLQTPLGVIQGTEDPLGPPEVVESILAEVPVKPVLLWIEGANHSFQGKEKAAVLEAVRLLKHWTDPGESSS